MPIPHISNIKYKGFHPVDKRKTIKIINQQIDEFNKLNNRILEKSLMIYANFCKQLTDKVNDSSLHYHRGYLTKFIGYSTSKAQKKLNKENKERENELKEQIQSITTNSKLSLEDIVKYSKNIYGPSGITGYEKGQIDKYKDYCDQLTATTFLTMKGFLREQQQTKINELITTIDALIKKIEEEYPESHQKHQKATLLKNSLEQLQKILSNKNGKLDKSSTECITNFTKDDRNMAAIIHSDKHLEYAPFPKCSPEINKIVLGFMAMITDGGTDLWKLIDGYIKNK